MFPTQTVGTCTYTHAYRVPASSNMPTDKALKLIVFYVKHEIYDHIVVLFSIIFQGKKLLTVTKNHGLLTMHPFHLKEEKEKARSF